MISKTLFIAVLFISFQAMSQDSNDVEVLDTSIAAQLFTKCFENLNQGAEINENNRSKIRFCSLLECMYLFGDERKDIQIIAEKRLIGITTQLFREGNPVYLIMGMDSHLNAKMKNENLDDDNHIVYVSYGQCTNPPYLIDAAKIVNKHTLFLIRQASE